MPQGGCLLHWRQISEEGCPTRNANVSRPPWASCLYHWTHLVSLLLSSLELLSPNFSLLKEKNGQLRITALLKPSWPKKFCGLETHYDVSNVWSLGQEKNLSWCICSFSFQTPSKQNRKETFFPAVHGYNTFVLLFGLQVVTLPV